MEQATELITKAASEEGRRMRPADRRDVDAPRSLARRIGASFAWVALPCVAALLIAAYELARAESRTGQARRADERAATARELIPAEASLHLAALLAAAGKGPPWDARHQAAASRLEEILKGLLAPGASEDLRAAVMRTQWALASRLRQERGALDFAGSGRAAEAEAALAAEPSEAARRALVARIDALVGSLEREGASNRSLGETKVTRAKVHLLAIAAAMLFLGSLLGWRLAGSLKRSLGAISRSIESALGDAAVDETASGGEIARIQARVSALIARCDKAEEGQRKAKEDLAAASASAGDLSRIKGDYLTRMSRELRTPVNGLEGMTRLLLESKLTPQQREFVAGFQASARQLISILDDMADFSRLESGKLALQRINFDLRLLMADAVQQARPGAEAKGLDLTVYMEEEIPSLVRGDPGRLRQVMSNLLGNAIKFTLAGEVSTRVSLVDESEANVTIKISIEDTGVGIDSGRQVTIFDEFAEAGLSFTRVAGATGLGLALCRELVHRMGGKIRLKSEVGKGSTFEFTVMLEKQARRETTHGVGGPSPARGLAFAVAANPARRRQIQEMLPRLGLGFSLFSGCDEALEALRRSGSETGTSYALGFVDELESEGEIPMFFEEVRRESALAPLAIVFIAVTGRRGDAEYARSLGCAGYLNGELTPGLLATVASRLLGRKVEEEQASSDFVTRHSLTEHRRRTARVLVAEDDEASRQVVLLILRKAGLRADGVDNGRAAVAAVQGRHYDLVLMDCAMPVMDGLEATVAIRRDEKGGRRMPIVALTGISGDGDRERCAAVGMDDFIAKPILPQALLSAVDKWILESSEEEEPTASAVQGTNGVEEAQAEPLDLTELRRQAEGDAVREQELIRTFLTDSSKHLSALRRAMHARRTTALERATTQLKDACDGLGVYPLRRIFEEIEFCACHDNLQAAEDLLGQAEAEFKKTQEFLETRLKQSPQRPDVIQPSDSQLD